MTAAEPRFSVLPGAGGYDELEIPEAEEPEAEPDAQPTADVEFVSSHGACTATWGAPYHVVVELDRFTEDRSELRAEVVVRSTAGLKRQLIAPRRVPLMGTRAPAELARDLTARLSGVDWREILEVTFSRAIEAHREGEPAVALPDVPVRITPTYALEPLALDRLLTVAWSRPGEGKTWIACAVAAALQSGRSDILGLAPARPMRVSILDWEDDATTKAERVRAIAGEPLPGIVYIACRDAIWNELDRIVRLVRQHDIEYLVIDSLGMACGGLAPESSEAALRFGTAFRRIGLGGFATAHMPKDPKADDSAPFGSVFWHAQLRLGWYVKRQENASGFSVGLYNRKSNNDRAPAPMAFDIAFASGRATFRGRDVADVPELAAKLPMRQRILGALRGGGLTLEDLEAAVGAEDERQARQVRARVSELRKAGVLTTTDGRLWLAQEKSA